MGVEQRQQLEWNMLDGSNGNAASTSSSLEDGSLTIVADDDLELKRETESEAAGDRVAGRKLAEIAVDNQYQNQNVSSGAHPQGLLQKLHTLDTHAQGLPAVPPKVRSFFEQSAMRKVVSQIPEHYCVCAPLYSKHHHMSVEMGNQWNWQAGKVVLSVLNDRESLMQALGESDGSSNGKYVNTATPTMIPNDIKGPNSETLCANQTPDFWPKMNEVKLGHECWLYLSETAKPMLYFEVEDHSSIEQNLTATQQSGYWWMTDRQKKRKSVERKRVMWKRAMLGLFWYVRVDGVNNPLMLFEKISDAGQRKFLVSITRTYIAFCKFQLVC
jgi:hypothetical protein